MRHHPGYARLETLTRRGRALLGSEVAIMGGAMTWVSERNLVAAISNAGGFGVIACGAMGPDLLAAEIEATRGLTDRPFGVNLILMHPELDRLIERCTALDVGHFVFAGGMPTREQIARAKAKDAKVLAFAPSAAIGKRLVKAGVDGLIIEGAEAGGHIGPVATSVLAQEVLPAIDEVPVFVAGGIGHGEAVAAYLSMGAAGCQLGTRFACARESIAHPRFKEAFVRGSARDAQTSVQVDPEFKVIPVRALANRATERFRQVQVETIRRYREGEIDYEAAALAIEQFWAGALRRAVVDGDVEEGSLMAGQSVGMVKAVEPTAAIVDTLVTQAAAALERAERLG